VIKLTTPLYISMGGKSPELITVTNTEDDCMFAWQRSSYGRGLDYGVVQMTGNNGLVQAVEQDKQGLCEITIIRGPSVYHHHL